MQEISAGNYIQAVAPESVEIVANNLYNAEIYARQDNTDESSYGNSPQFISFNFKENQYDKSITHFNGSFIHNLSTNKQKVQQIRAP